MVVVVVTIFNLGWLHREVVVSTLCGVTYVLVKHTL